MSQARPPRHGEVATPRTSGLVEHGRGLDRLRLGDAFMGNLKRHPHGSTQPLRLGGRGGLASLDQLQ